MADRRISNAATSASQYAVVVSSESGISNRSNTLRSTHAGESAGDNVHNTDNNRSEKGESDNSSENFEYVEDEFAHIEYVDDHGYAYSEDEFSDDSDDEFDDSLGMVLGRSNLAGYREAKERAKSTNPYRSQQMPPGGFNAASGQLNSNPSAFRRAGFVPRGPYYQNEGRNSLPGLNTVSPEELSNMPENNLAWTKSKGYIIEMNDALFEEPTRYCRMVFEKNGICSAGHDFESARQAAWDSLESHRRGAPRPSHARQHVHSRHSTGGGPRARPVARYQPSNRAFQGPRYATQNWRGRGSSFRQNDARNTPASAVWRASATAGPSGWSGGLPTHFVGDLDQNLPPNAAAMSPLALQHLLQTAGAGTMPFSTGSHPSPGLIDTGGPHAFSQGANLMGYGGLGVNQPGSGRSAARDMAGNAPWGIAPSHGPGSQAPPPFGQGSLSPNFAAPPLGPWNRNIGHIGHNPDYGMSPHDQGHQAGRGSQSSGYSPLIVGQGRRSFGGGENAPWRNPQ
ncbi:MAG: hypothetical protein Q9227_007656 [Pyrenula ochraceoflavens]